MKISIDVELSAAEVRETLGLPNVKAIQDVWLMQVAEKINENSKYFSPEAIVKQWVAGAGGGADLLNTMMSGIGAMAKGKK